MGAMQSALFVVVGLAAAGGEFLLARRRDRRNAAGCCARCGNRLSNDAAIPVTSSNRTNFYCPGCAKAERLMFLSAIAVMLACVGIVVAVAFAAHR